MASVKKHLYYVQVLVEVSTVIQVQAVDEQEAFARANDGAWHGVISTDWDHAKIKAVGKFTKGPGIN